MLFVADEKAKLTMVIYGHVARFLFCRCSKVSFLLVLAEVTMGAVSVIFLRLTQITLHRPSILYAQKVRPQKSNNRRYDGPKAGNIPSTQSMRYPYD